MCLSPPPVILKLMILLTFYNVRSERELMDTLPERLDWLWFLGYDLDSEVPHHSVLSKARRRWGAGLFQTFFERIVLQCVEAGLVEGKKLFVDASLVDGHHTNTGRGVKTVVADSKYRTIANFLACGKRGLRAHMPPLTDAQRNKGRRDGWHNRTQ